MVAVLLPGPGSAWASEANATVDECTPSLSALVNGRSPASVAPPDGFVDTASLRIDVDAGFHGIDCERVLNTAPRLLGAWLHTPLTSVGQTFAYEVTYVDLDNDPPARIWATLDGRLERDMIPLDAEDREYRDGAVYVADFGMNFIDDAAVPEALAGDHHAIIRAADGTAEAVPVDVAGPRLVDLVAGSLVAPNPANRMAIHPIANGPTFTPPTEMPPPAPEEADGVYSHRVPIDAAAGVSGARWSVGTGFGLGLADYGQLEGPAEGGAFALGGAAQLDSRAHGGQQAVLFPSGQESSLRAMPNSETYRFALLGSMRVHALAPDAMGPTLNLMVELDRDADGTADACIATDASFGSSDDWQAIRIQRDDAVRLLEDGCSRDATPEGGATMNSLQDDASLGLSRILALRISAAAPPTDVLIDTLALETGFPNSRGDVDACLYAEADVPTQPTACQSDIGPNSGIVPPGATHANVWADQIVPILSFEDPVPARAYLEPLAFSFSYEVRAFEGPSFTVPQPPTARVTLWPDADLNGAPDSGSTPAADSGPVPVAVSHTFSFNVPFEVADGAYGFVLVYETGRDSEVVTQALAIQRFVNQKPLATLTAAAAKHPRVAILELSVHDEDDAQGALAGRLGGLTSWDLDFGDGQRLEGNSAASTSLEHTYPRPGTYNATLTAVDAQGASASTTIQVRVGPGGPSA